MSFEVEFFVIDSSASANRYITLAGAPDSTKHVALDIIGGTAQLFGAVPAYGGDFIVDSSRVKWDYPSSPLYPLVSIGDKMRVIYDRS